MDKELLTKASKRTPRAWQKYLLLAAGLALGLFLIAFGSSDGKKSAQKSGDTAEIKAYSEMLEEKIRMLCESVSGVERGSATVSVTLEGGFETVYAEDGEKRSSQSGDSVSKKHATVGGGSSEAPIKLGVRTPRIAGVGVVCRGGGDAVTQAELISLISAAFGIGAGKIYIAESN